MTKEIELSSLLQSAISMESSDECREFLDQSCAGKKNLRARLQMILDSLPESEVAKVRPEPSPPPANQSVLQSLSASAAKPPQVYLDDSIHTQSDPVIQPASPEIPALPNHSRYQLQGEIARGGMGAILKGRDVDLGRTLAVKVLLEAHKDNDLAIERFIEEAQIGGQLQHPGIAPIYELGRFDDRRPFFTMKLVQGDTLAWLLMTRRTAGQDRSKLLGIFEQVCQTVAYAHSRRVIHRDLKPANIMVGAFGEVQVMDWGLAKVLPKEGQPVKESAPDPLKGQSVIQTIRSTGFENEGDESAPAGRFAGASVGSATQMGSAMGTPAYMPPEQALGEVDQMDRRGDVFGLGAILCEILTGEPPYVADTTQEILRLATRAKLDDCFRRLDECGADASLIDMTKRCLSPDADDRPADAGQLAAEVTNYLQSVDEKLHETKIQSAREAARAEEESKRRRVALALAASILLLLGLGGGAWIQVQGQHRFQIAAATGHLDEAIGQAKYHQGLAEEQSLTVQDAELSKAILNAERAVELSNEDGIDANKQQAVAQLLAQLQTDAKQVRTRLDQQARDQLILDKLDRIRVDYADGGTTLHVANDEETFATEDTIRQYRALFDSLGLDLKLDANEAAVKIRESAISEQLITALDNWVWSIPKVSLLELQREAVGSGNWAEAREILKQRLNESPENSQLWLSLAPLTIVDGDMEDYRNDCRQMMKQFSKTDDWLVSLQVVRACTLIPNGVVVDKSAPRALESALDENRIANRLDRIRMFAWSTRAMLEYRRGNTELAYKYTQTAQRYSGPDPAKAYTLAIQAMAQHDLGQEAASKKSLDESSKIVDRILGRPQLRKYFQSPLVVLVLREATSKIYPEEPEIDIAKLYATDASGRSDAATKREHYQVRSRLVAIANAADDNAWRKKIRQAFDSDDKEALIEAAKAPEVHEQTPTMIAWLAGALNEAKQYESAVNVLEPALQRTPTDFWLNFELAKSLSKLNRSSAALGYARAALALQPKSTAAVWLVVAALDDVGRAAESLAVYRQSLTQTDMSPKELVSLSRDLRYRGRHQQAEATARKAIEADPDSAEAYESVARILDDVQQHDASIQAARKATELAPNDRDIHFSLAYVLGNADRPEQSAAAYRRVLEIDSKYAVAYNNLGNQLQELRQYEEAVKMHREAVRLAPSDHRYHGNLRRSLAALAREQGNPSELLDEILRLSAGRPSPGARIFAYRRRLELNPRDHRTRTFLAQRLMEARRYEEAITEFRKILASDATNAQAHLGLGTALANVERLDDAIDHFRRAAELDSEAPHLQLQLAAAAHAYAVGAPYAGSRVLLPPRHPDGLKLTDEQAALLDEAIVAYQKAVELRKNGSSTTNDENSTPSSALQIANSALATYRFRSGLAQALRLRGRTEEAEAVEQEIDAALETADPDDQVSGRLAALRFLQEINDMKRRGEEPEAVAVMRDYLATNADKIVIAAELGRTLGKLGRSEEAIEVFESIIRRRPDAIEGYLGLGRLYAFNEPAQPDKALATFDRAINADLGVQQKAFLHTMKGSVYLSEKRWDEALAAYDEALELHPGSGIAYSGIGEVHLGKGNPDDAIAALRKSVKFSPRDGTCHHSLAQALISVTGDDGKYPHVDEALKHALRAVAIFEFSPTGTPPPAAWLHTAGVVYYRKRDYEQAMQYLLDAEKGGLSSFANGMFLAMTDWQLKNYDEARQRYSQTLQDFEGAELSPTAQEYASEARRLITR